MTDQVRKGQYAGKLERIEFGRRFRNAFVDPAFRGEDEAIAGSRRSPGTPTRKAARRRVTRKAGPGFADPDYDLSVEWLRDARARCERAQARMGRPGDAVARAA